MIESNKGCLPGAQTTIRVVTHAARLSTVTDRAHYSTQICGFES